MTEKAGEGDKLHPASSEKDSALEDELGMVLHHARRLILKYPFAAQALFSSLMQEGRRFAETEAGQRWKARLEGTDLVRQGTALWEASTLNILEDDPDTVLPSALLEAFVQATERRSFEEQLTDFLRRQEDA